MFLGKGPVAPPGRAGSASSVIATKSARREFGSLGRMTTTSRKVVVAATVTEELAPVESTSSEPTKGLHAKLVEAWSEVEKVDKDKRNDFQKYDYVSAEAILTLLRKPLLERGIVLFSELVDLGEREYETSGGKASVITTVRVKFSFIDSVTGESWSAEWAGQGDDPADKGLGKAYTNAVKTFLRQQAMLPQGDDPEADPKADERGKDRAPKKTNGKLSDKQLALLRKLYGEKKPQTAWLRTQLIAAGAPNVPDEDDALLASLSEIPGHVASKVIEALMEVGK